MLKEGVSSLWMNEVLNDGVSAKRRNNCWTELFRRWGGEKDDGKGMRNTEQWYFSTKRGETIAGRNCFVDDGG
jgi:hypothetical protein